LNALTSLIQEIAGFFIVETHVLNTTGNFRSEQELEELWDSLLGRLCLALDDALGTETDPEGYLRVKEALIGFIMTMEVCISRPSALIAFDRDREDVRVSNDWTAFFHPYPLREIFQPSREAIR
jgi:hypothetical protein